MTIKRDEPDINPARGRDMDKYPDNPTYANLYGFCPVCGAPGEMRERRPDGDDECKNGHRYKSTSALPNRPTNPGIHPAPTEFSAQQLAEDPILRFFHYAHLPPQLQGRSKPFMELACLIINGTPRNAERTVALRKLLEAKDAAVRAAL